MVEFSSPLEPVVKLLSESIATPSEETPSVRCITRPSLLKLLDGILGKLASSPSYFGRLPATPTAALRSLVRAGLATQYVLDEVGYRVPANRFFILGFGIGPDEIDPMELLQVHAPMGFLCYFSAIVDHGLTTQFVSHHHIGITRSIDSRKPSRPTGLRKADRNAPPIGTFLFRVGSIPFFLTRRDPGYVRDLQVRHLDGKARYKVTSLEQTIVDTLHRPMSCGGPAVVFEAWESARGRLRSEVLLKILSSIGDNLLCRRVGFMMDKFDLPLSSSVQSLLAGAKGSHFGSNAGNPDTLLTGIPYPALDAKWGLFVP